MRLLAILLCWISSTILYAQKPYADLTDAMTRGAVLSGKSGPSGVVWIEDGKRYSYKKGAEIRIYDPKTQQDESVFSPSGMKFPGTTENFNYQSFEWSKDFRFLVFRTNVKPVWRNSGSADYYLYDVSNKKLTQIAQQVYTAQLSPDGTKLGFEKEGNLYVLTLSTAQLKKLTNNTTPLIYNGRFGWVYEEEFGLVRGWEWNHDGSSIAYWQTDERKVPLYGYTDYTGFKENYTNIPYPRVGDPVPAVKIGVVQIATGKTVWMQLNADDAYIPRIYWTADPQKIALVHLNRKQNHMQMYFGDVQTGAIQKIFEEKTDTWVDVFSFGAGIMHFFYFPENKKEFFWKSERDGWSHIYRYDYKGKLINQVTQGKWDMVKMVYADGLNQKLYYVSTEISPLERHLYVIDFNGSNKKQLTQATGDHTINFGGEYFIDTYSNTTQPKQVVLFDKSGNKLKTLEDNKEVTAFVQTNMYSPRVLETFKASDGQKLDISILKPMPFDSTKQYPVIMEVYGGPEHQSVHNDFATNAWQQYMTQLGFVIVQVNNRGSANYGSDFKKAVYGKLGYWECFDFAETAKYMGRKKWVAADRFAIKGHSYGGFTSAYSVATYPDLFKAAIIAAPVTDWRIYDAVYTERFMGVLPESKAAYDKSAVLPWVKNIKAKMLITHSTGDDNVHVRNTMQLLKTLIDLGKDADLRLYQSGGHGIAYSFESSRLLQQQYVDFLQKTIGK